MSGKRPPVTGFELSDLGNRDRFIAAHGNDFKFVSQWGWMTWDGLRYADDTGSLRARKAVAKVARGIRKEAAQAGSKKEFERVAAHAVRSEADARITAALHLAEPELAASVEDFDQHPFLLNTRSGTVDLRDGKLRAHRREDLLTQLASFAYDPEAGSPQWERFLEEIFPDPEVRLFVWKAVGYSSTGDIGEQVLLFCHGGGANGKSTFLETASHVLGDYAKAAAPGLLLTSNHEEHPTGLADLRGARFVTSIETGENKRLDEAQVKALTGGDTIVARHMRRDFFRFKPTHKLWLASNHKPSIRGTDHAIWRRIRLIPFTTTIQDEHIDPELPAKLKEEAPGILAWIIRGAQLWSRDRLKPPAAVVQAVAEYRSSEDLVGRWIADRMDFTPAATTTAKDLYSDFKIWCEGEGIRRTPSRKKLGDSLKERGFKNEHDRNGWFWIGITLRESNYTGQNYPERGQKELWS